MLTALVDMFSALGYPWIMLKSTELHRLARQSWEPVLYGAGFRRVPRVRRAAWLKNVPGGQFLLVVLQPSRNWDPFGWYGSKFTVEFQLADRPELWLGTSRRLRLASLLNDEQREMLRAQNNKVRAGLGSPPPEALQGVPDTDKWYLAEGEPITSPYPPNHDVWFQHATETDAQEWATLIGKLLPDALAEVSRRWAPPAEDQLGI